MILTYSARRLTVCTGRPAMRFRVVISPVTIVRSPLRKESGDSRLDIALFPLHNAWIKERTAIAVDPRRCPIDDWVVDHLQDLVAEGRPNGVDLVLVSPDQFSTEEVVRLLVP